MARDYSGYSVEQLLQRINVLEAQLASTKYGLYWDKEIKPEDVVQKCLSYIPVLKENRDFCIESPNPVSSNILIEGDNFHVLAALKTIAPESGLVDVIYIDPPYNTGAKDFKYNDSFVDVEDGYRHSKWLSFMEKRLLLAKSLLKENGVIFISIDDNEANNLGLLCNQIFGEANFIAEMPRIVKKSGKTTDTVAKNHDYVYIYCKNSSLISFARVAVERGSGELLEDEHVKERGPYRLNQCLDYDSLSYSESMDYPLVINGETFYPGGSKEDWEARRHSPHKKYDWTWRWSQSLVDWGLKNDFIVIKNGRRKRIYTKSYTNCFIQDDGGGKYSLQPCEDTKAYDSLTFLDNVYSNDNAKKELKAFEISEKFDFPKPTSLIKTCLQMFGKKDALVMDFFAGSGTTGQAVLDLNKEDGGARRFILCTNNENDICQKITFPRLKTVITGIQPDGKEYSDPTNTNLYYYQTDFVKDSPSRDQAKYNLVFNIPELLGLSEGIMHFEHTGESYSVYSSVESGRKMFVYFDLGNSASLNKMIEEANLEKTNPLVFIFSLDNTIDTMVQSRMPKSVLKPVPAKIYEIYKHLVEDIKND